MPDLRTRGVVGDFWNGLWLVPRAWGLLARSPRLWAWTALAALVTGVALAAVGVGAWWLAAAWSEGWVEASWARVALKALLFPLLFSAGALTAPNLALAPLADPLSGAASVACGRAPPPGVSFLPATLLALRHTLGRLAVVTLGTAGLFLLNLVPGVGTGLWAALSTLWTAWWLAAEHLSTPMALRGHPLGEVVAILRARVGLALGLGLALFLLLWVPVLNAFLWPAAVVAGTLLFEGLSDGKVLPNRAVTLSSSSPSR